MAQKKTKKSTFTAQVRVELIADVEVEANTLEEALEVGKTWKLCDVVTLDAAASEYDSRVSLVGGWSHDGFSLD